MNQSESIKNLADALLQFDSKVATISKSETNPFFKNKYAPLPQILSEIKEPLQECGLTVKQFPEGEHGLTTIIFHPLSGEWLSSTYFMKPVKDDPQAEGSRITYQRRYALGAVLGLNIDVDDDANAASEPEQEKDERPWLSKKQFDQAMQRIQQNDLGQFESAEAFVTQLKGTYRMKRDYRIALEDELTSEFNAALNEDVQRSKGTC